MTSAIPGGDLRRRGNAGGCRTLRRPGKEACIQHLRLVAADSGDAAGTGRHQPRPQPAPRACRLRDVVLAACDSLADAAARPGVSLACDVSPEIELTLDRPSVERVFQNLIANAIDALPHGGHVRVSAESADHSVIVSVEDDGPASAAKCGRICSSLSPPPASATEWASGWPCRADHPRSRRRDLGRLHDRPRRSLPDSPARLTPRTLSARHDFTLCLHQANKARNAMTVTSQQV